MPAVIRDRRPPGRNAAGRLSLLSLAVGAAAFGPGGCSDGGGGSPFRVAFETEHFRYLVEEGAAVCADSGPLLERHYDAYTAYLGPALPAGQKFDYYLYKDVASLANDNDSCAIGEATGCQEGKSIRSTVPILGHEIVHVVAGLRAQAPPLLTEGLAVVLGCLDTSDAVAGPIVPDPQLGALLDASAWWQPVDMDADRYAQAASFVRFLIDQHGRQAFLDAYFDLPTSASQSDWDRTFTAAFQSNVAAELAAWMAAGPRFYSEICLHVVEQELPLLTDGHTTELQPTCPVGAFGIDRTQVTGRFNVPQDRCRLKFESTGTYVARFHRVSGGDVTAGVSTAATLAPGMGGLAFGASQFFLSVPAGDYFLQASAPAGASPVPLAVTVSCAQPDGCSSADVRVDATVGEPVFLLSRWSSLCLPDGGGRCAGPALELVPAASGTFQLLPAIQVLSTQQTFATGTPSQLFSCDADCGSPTCSAAISWTLDALTPLGAATQGTPFRLSHGPNFPTSLTLAGSTYAPSGAQGEFLDYGVVLVQ
jgi:hypothetical protein